MSFRYVVLGAGMQGTAAAYDLTRFGDAEKVLLADIDLPRARRAAELVNFLARRAVAAATRVDVGNVAAVAGLLQGSSAVLSVVPFRHNVGIARAAVQARTHLCDLGGNTEVVFQELEQDEQARAAGISIVPDCGVMPGMGNLLAVHGMNRLEQLGAACREVRIHVGGLPQKPRPPLSYKLVFNIEGLIDLYVSRACGLRDGKITQLDPLTELEEVEFPAPVGRCEACITSGGTSTCPCLHLCWQERVTRQTSRHFTPAAR